MPILGTADIADLRSLLADVLAHTYTRLTPGAAGAEDAWGQATYGADATTAGAACLYQPSERLGVDAQGLTAISQPALLVRYDDALAVSDRVSDIRDNGGTLLIAGPLAVDTLEPVAGAGQTLYKRALLSAAEVSR